MSQSYYRDLAIELCRETSRRIVKLRQYVNSIDMLSVTDEHELFKVQTFISDLLNMYFVRRTLKEYFMWSKVAPEKCRDYLFCAIANFPRNPIDPWW